MSLSFISSGVITNEITLHHDVELEYFSYQIKYSGSLRGCRVISGELPQNLSLTGDGLIYGYLREMDDYVFNVPPIDIKQDGTHYATYGSPQAYIVPFTFTVIGFGRRGSTDTTTLTILKHNNYSSDRDQLVRDLDEKFGTLDFDGNRKYFAIEGTQVTSEEFISYQKNTGLYHRRG